MTADGRQVFYFAVPEFDAPEADKFLETCRTSAFLEITRYVDTKEIMKNKEKMVLPIVRYRVLVLGSKEEAERLTDFLINEKWFPTGQDWAVRLGEPGNDWEKEEKFGEDDTV